MLSGNASQLFIRQLFVTKLELAQFIYFLLILTRGCFFPIAFSEIVEEREGRLEEKDGEVGNWLVASSLHPKQGWEANQNPGTLAKL